MRSLEVKVPSQLSLIRPKQIFTLEDDIALTIYILYSFIVENKQFHCYRNFIKKEFQVFVLAWTCLPPYAVRISNHLSCHSNGIVIGCRWNFQPFTNVKGGELSSWLLFIFSESVSFRPTLNVVCFATSLCVIYVVSVFA